MKKHNNTNKKGTFQKGKDHPNWKGGISKDKGYEKNRYTGKRKEANLKRLRSRTKEQIKNEFIKSTYGIDLDEYWRMWKSQKGVCLICGNKETRKSRYGGICKLTIDHCHKTKKVRGLLCHKCNNGLGQFKDNIKVMKKAIQYLNTTRRLNK